MAAPWSTTCGDRSSQTQQQHMAAAMLKPANQHGTVKQVTVQGTLLCLEQMPEKLAMLAILCICCEHQQWQCLPPPHTHTRTHPHITLAVTPVHCFHTLYESVMLVLTGCQQCNAMTATLINRLPVCMVGNMQAPPVHHPTKACKSSLPQATAACNFPTK